MLSASSSSSCTMQLAMSISRQKKKKTSLVNGRAHSILKNTSCVHLVVGVTIPRMDHRHVSDDQIRNKATRSIMSIVSFTGQGNEYAYHTQHTVSCPKPYDQNSYIIATRS